MRLRAANAAAAAAVGNLKEGEAEDGGGESAVRAEQRLVDEEAEAGHRQWRGVTTELGRRNGQLF